MKILLKKLIISTINFMWQLIYECIGCSLVGHMPVKGMVVSSSLTKVCKFSYGSDHSADNAASSPIYWAFRKEIISPCSFEVDPPGFPVYFSCTPWEFSFLFFLNF